MLSGKFMQLFTIVVVYADVLTFYSFCKAILPL